MKLVTYGTGLVPRTECLCTFSSGWGGEGLPKLRVDL